VTRERVCIEDSSALADFDPYADEEANALTFDQLQGKTVVEQEGGLLGVLVDFAFMLSDGRICDLVVLGGEDEKRVKVAVEAIRSVGRDYIVIERGLVAVAAPVEPPAPAKPAQPAAPAAPSAAPAEAHVPAGGDPLPADVIEHAAARIAEVPLPAAEAGEALFTPAAEPGKLTKFDQKKADFLRGKKAHRDISAPGGEVLVAKGATFDDKVIAALAQHQLLGDVFVEMTVSR
jgi:sporulation protein YlmC with PRC-barrel domain